jgi:hypothetical protein
MPVALSDELDTTRPVTPVQFAGEHLVLFRDGSGSLGLLARHCPHRGVDLCQEWTCATRGWKTTASGARFMAGISREMSNA